MAECGLCFCSPAAQADENGIDEPGFGRAFGVGEQIDADIELADRLFETTHVPAGHGGDEACVTSRPQILGAGAGCRLTSALERRVEGAGDGRRQRHRLCLTHLDAREARAVIEGAREGFHLVAELLESLHAARRDSCGPQLEICIELEVAVNTLPRAMNGVDARLVKGERGPISRVGLGFRGGSIEIRRGRRPHLTAHGMAGQLLDVFWRMIASELLESAQDARVKYASALAKQALIRDLEGERVLEGVFKLGEEAALIQELGCLELGETVSELQAGSLRHRLQE